MNSLEQEYAQEITSTNRWKIMMLTFPIVTIIIVATFTIYILTKIY